MAGIELASSRLIPKIRRSTPEVTTLKELIEHHVEEEEEELFPKVEKKLGEEQLDAHSASR